MAARQASSAAAGENWRLSSREVRSSRREECGDGHLSRRQNVPSGHDRKPVYGFCSLS